MRLVFTDKGWDDYLWFHTADRKLLKRINLLIKIAYVIRPRGSGNPNA